VENIKQRVCVLFYFFIQCVFFFNILHT
jgi:hypothetical protein